MSIASVLNQVSDQAIVTINVSECFDYQCVHDFHRAYADGSHPNADYVVDLERTRYIDSCALGMLLSLDRVVRKRSKSLKIVNCNDHVRKIFAVVQFDKKLAIV